MSADFALFVAVALWPIMVSGLCGIIRPLPSQIKQFFKRLAIGYLLFGSTIAFSALFVVFVAPLLEGCNAGAHFISCRGEIFKALGFWAEWNFVLTNFIFGLAFVGVEVWLRASSLRTTAA
jgi:hypothetical protein